MSPADDSASQRGTGARCPARSTRGKADAAPSTTALRSEQEQPLDEIGSRMRRGIGAWLDSPAFDTYALSVLGTLLIGTGLVMVLSSSSVANIARGASGFAGLTSQGMFALIGLVGMVVAVLMKPSFYRKMAYPLLGLGLLLQLLVHTPLGVDVAGNRNWIRVGSMTLQPSELLKLSLAVWLGAIMAAKRRLLHRPAHLLFPMAVGVLASLGLVILGRDLGTMMVMAMLVAGSLWVAGVPKRWFALGGALGAVGIVGLAVSSSNRMARISNWLHGECPGDSCMQSQSGLMGLAEGGWWGVGLGESRQKWGRLPAAQDDYIFAIIGEELGLFGTLSVLLMFAALAIVLCRMIVKVDDVFQQVTIAGVASWLLGQAFVNMMVVTGLLPVLGVPLPFISSGGSALVASMLALGMLISFARHEPGAAEALSARVRDVRRSISVLPARSGAAEKPARPRRRRRIGRRGGRRSGGSPDAETTRSSRSSSTKARR